MDGRILNVIGGCVGLVIGLGIVTGSIRAKDQLPASMGWVFIVFCTGMLAVPLLWASWQRANSRYAITNRRALILRHAFGMETLKSWQIRTLPSIEVSGLWRKSVWLENSQSGFFTGRTSRKMGFEMIEDAEVIYRLLIKIQRDAP